MKPLLMEEIEKMALEITQEISSRVNSLKKEFGPEIWSDLNRTWGAFNEEISSRKVKAPDWTLDEMLAMRW